MKKFCDIINRNDLADFLSLQIGLLTYLLYVKGVDYFYQEFDIPKKNDGIRRIKAPVGALKAVQKKLMLALTNYQQEIIKDYNLQSEISHAFEKDKSIITNAKIHRNKRYVINFDLEDFFDSFHFGRVKGFFEKNKYFRLPEEVAITIAQLTCYKGTLPQGAPTSPVITNLISQILDLRLLQVARKYKLDYTRYADDLTFSTNNSNFLNEKEKFYEDIEKEIVNAGFKLNHNKTRLQFKDSKQIVTGLVVNKKVNIDCKFYKNTRAMAFSLYKNGEFIVNGEQGTINQLEGRFAFIDNIDRYNNKIDGNKHSISNLNRREKEYRKFLFYKYFIANNFPLILTEGKTDKLYLKAALKKYYKEYPQLIDFENNKFNFKISFLQRSKRLKYFFDLNLDGADTLKNIYKFYNDELEDVRFPNYFRIFNKFSDKKPENPVIFIYDNEINNTEKPLHKFFNTIKLKDAKEKDTLKDYLEKENWIKLPLNINVNKNMQNEQIIINERSNIFLVSIPIINNKNEAEIEDLFDEDTLNTKLDGKVLDKTGKKDNRIFYNKDKFAEYIINNYDEINFNGFKKLLDIINKIIEEYKSSK